MRRLLATTLFVLVALPAGCAGSEPRSSSEAGSPAGSPGPTAQAASSTGSERGGRSTDEPGGCRPTRPDSLGPFYEPGAPVRTSVGSGYVLSGAVLAAGSCDPVGDARIEFWLANPAGEYDDAHRATVPVGDGGGYRFESNVPVAYGGRPPHVHIRVTASGYRELVTQHYPGAGQTGAKLDLVLEPQ